MAMDNFQPTNIISKSKPYEIYKKDLEGNDIYAYGSDNKPIFAKRFKDCTLTDSCTYYAKNNEGSEIYPRHVNGREQVMKDKDRNPIYARKNNGIQFYPRKPNSDEFIPTNGSLIKLPNGKEIIPIKYSEKPRKLSNSIESILNIGDEQSGQNIPKYNRDTNGNEIYPSDGTFIKDEATGKLIYAISVDNKVIFPKDKDGNEFYLKDNFQHDLIFYGNNIEIDRYAKRNNGDEFYPRRHSNLNPLLFYDLIIRNKYARQVNNEPFYPMDSFNNEFTLIPRNENEYNYCFPIGYPITNDNFYILPVTETELVVQLPKMQIDESRRIQFLYRGDMGFRDILTNVKCSTRNSKALEIIDYNYSELNTLKPEATLSIPKKPKMTISQTPTSIGGAFSKIFYILITVAILAIVLLLAWKNKHVLTAVTSVKI